MSVASSLYRDHEYKGSRTAVDDEFRSGIYSLNGTEADVTEGAIIQPAAKFDQVVDPDVSVQKNIIIELEGLIKKSSTKILVVRRLLEYWY